MSEKNVHLAVINYLRLQYPKVIFRSDTGAGMRLTIGQAKQQKAIQNGMAYPDLFIAAPRGMFHGMFIELKNDGVKLFSKNNAKSGIYANDHIKEQAECLEALEALGYYTTFAIGFDDAKFWIDWYLNGMAEGINDKL